jgi:hypothetical protein
VVFDGVDHPPSFIFAGASLNRALHSGFLLCSGVTHFGGLGS